MRVFEGRTAVITGGGTGIGAAVALALAETGVNISLIGRRLERLQSVAARARGLGAETACYSTDLADNSAQVELTRRLTRDLRNLDILVQNAGTYSAGPIEEGSLAQLDAPYYTNARAPYILTRALLPLLKACRGGGSVY